MPATHHIFLVPGFFGFLNLGELTYFARVSDLLVHRLAEAGVTCKVTAVGTLPTASLRSRAAHLAAAVHQHAPGGEPLHFVGHSSGGLDIRLLLTPSVSLPTKVDVEAIGRRTRSVITVAAPHHGSPLASAATGVLGQKLLRTLSVITIHALRLGRKPVRGLVRAGQVLIRLDDMVGLGGSLLDQLYAQVLRDFSDERSQSLERYLGHVRGDQALLPQVTPDGMDLFNAHVSDRPGVPYSSVVTRARPPSLLGAFAVGLDPVAQTTHAIYHALHRLVARMPAMRLPNLTGVQEGALADAYGRLPEAAANDAIVPTRSQVWGTVIHATAADHLDVMGYYGDVDWGPNHVDWLVTRSGFDRSRFRALWGAVARAVEDAS